MEIGYEEDRSNQQYSKEDSQNDATGFSCAQICKIRNAMTTAHDDEKCKNTCSKRIVDRNESECPFERVGSRVD